MDINSLITPQALFAAGRPSENALNLKVGQQLDVKVIGADIQAAKTAIALTLGNKDITVQSNQPITLNPRQDLKIQVTQIAPVVEFKILAPELKNQTADLRLKLLPTARDGSTIRPTATPEDGASSLELKQPLAAKIVGIAGNKIQLQIFSPQAQVATETGNKQAALINIDKNQLSNAPLNLKVGQKLNLEVAKTGAAPEFKVIPAANAGQAVAAKITGIAGNNIQLQIFNASGQAGGAHPAALVTIDKNQLGNAPSTLKVGQNLNLEVVKAGTAPEFKVISAANTSGSSIEAKITGISGNKIQLQVLTNAPAKTGSAMTIERTQLGNAPSHLKIGQNLNLEVVKAGAAPEFKVIPAANNSGTSIEAKITGITGNNIQLQVFTDAPDSAMTIDRAQLSNAPSHLKVGQSLNLEIVKAGTAPEFKVLPESQANKQPVEAKITAIAGNKIQLQLFTTTPASVKTDSVITIERTQLSNAPADLKVGQSLSLDIVLTGNAPEFKMIAAAKPISEAAVTEFIKQFLPRHEAAPIFLNQLINDLPQLLNNQSVSQTLKTIAANIINNLPPKEQLVSSLGLKQAIADSGLFLEAKLPPVMDQTEFIKQLPQLIKNQSVPQSLQRMAGEIMRNLTQKESLPDGSGVEQAIDLKLIAEAPLSELNPAKPADAANADATQVENTLEPLLKADTAEKALPGVAAEDFKANLLKFIQALKQELGAQDGQQPVQADLDLLKNLQNKTENTVAGIVLDQLMSLPKDDSPKQLWSIDIPFIDRQQAETVKIEIQQDKESRQQSSGGGNWSVNITVTPPELGTIHCIVSYRDDVINTYFKSLSPQTTELIKHNLDYLKNQLEESGLTTGHMDAHDGAQKTQAPHPLAGKTLFDESA